MTHSEDRSTGDGEKHLYTLEATGLFRPEQIQALRDHWIETIEQFLSTTATAEGCEGMVRLLDVSEGAINRWEKGKSDSNKPAEALIRALYAEHIEDEGGIKRMLKRIINLEDLLDETLTLRKRSGKRWERMEQALA